MKAVVHRFCKLTLGWVLVFLGIIGWLLPILPGTPFMILGVAILSTQSDCIRKRIDSLKVRFPRQVAGLRILKESLAAKIRRAGTS
ncbi:MAG: DUF454 family protein [Candidatus Binatota bacterium]